MPSDATRYRWKTLPSGKKVRLGFKDNKVVEVKKKGGVAHTVTPSKKRAKKR